MSHREFMRRCFLFPMLLARLCISQSTSSQFKTGNLSISEPCGAVCQLAANAYTRTVIATPMAKISIGHAEITSVIFTAFSVTSTYFSNGECTSKRGTPTLLPTPFPVTRPETVASSIFPEYATSSFANFLGFASCQYGGNVPYDLLQMKNSSTSLSATSSTISLPRSTAINATKASPPTLYPNSDSRGLTMQSKIGIGVGFPLAVAAMGSLATIFWLRLRTRGRKGVNVKKEDNTPEGDQPYLQRKGELEAAERRKHELEGAKIVYELEGGDGVHELSDTERKARQELRGKEFSQELNG